MKRFFIYLLLPVLMIACQSANVLETPPEIIYGQDVCTECSMIINDPRFAAAYVTTDEQIRLFDDIGDMLAYDARNQETVHIYWVHDFNTEAWINASTATLIMHSELISPMGWGLAAFQTAEDAAAYRTAHGGLTMTFADLRQSVASGAFDPELLHDHASHMETDMVHEEMDDEEMGHADMNHASMDHDSH